MVLVVASGLSRLSTEFDSSRIVPYGRCPPVPPLGALRPQDALHHLASIGRSLACTPSADGILAMPGEFVRLEEWRCLVST